MQRAEAYAGVIVVLDILFPERGREDVAAPDDAAVVTLERWRRGGLRLAGVTGSSDVAARVRRSGLGALFAAIQCPPPGVDTGSSATPDPWRGATSRLGVAPADTVAIVETGADVRAALATGCGLVVGIGPDGGARAAGASSQVTHLRGVRFSRRVPSLFDHLDTLDARLDDRPVAVCLDYDGTLTPIVSDPEAARLDDATRAVLERVAARYPVVVLSGRDRADVASRVGLDRIVYAGSHGFDIAGLATTMTLPEAEAARAELIRAGDELTARLSAVSGVVIERKRFSVATHYRNVEPGQIAQVRRVVADVLREFPGLRPQPGKMVIDLRPDVEWDKGHALHWILGALGLGEAPRIICYVGDDETDEDVFGRLGRDDIGVRVGPAVQATQADYQVARSEDVRRWLEWWAAR